MRWFTVYACAVLLACLWGLGTYRPDVPRPDPVPRPFCECPAGGECCCTDCEGGGCSCEGCPCGGQVEAIPSMPRRLACLSGGCGDSALAGMADAWQEVSEPPARPGWPLCLHETCIVLLDGKSCQLADVPVGAVVIRLDVKRWTVRRLEFRSK